MRKGEERQEAWHRGIPRVGGTRLGPDVGAEHSALSTSIVPLTDKQHKRLIRVGL